MSVPIARGQKNDFNDAEAIAEAVQRPTMKFVATKTAEQLDLQALHRVRERLVSQRTGIINQIRAFMLERGIAVRQGIGFLRTELPTILATRTDGHGRERPAPGQSRTPSPICATRSHERPSPGRLAPPRPRAPERA
ncbi:transposase [Nitrobacteraceae bacterium AZCC 2161]